MRTALAAAIIVVAATPVFAHRLDEYLQGTIISVEKNRIQAQMTLTPGVAVYPFVISSIDTNGDGTISHAEQRAYAGQVLGDLSLMIDGHPLAPRFVSIQFPTTDDMKEGRGEIQLVFSAELPDGGHSRKFTLENHHQTWISAYQVNCLVPHDPDIRITAQNRNYTQSFYELDYLQSEVRSDHQPFFVSWSGRPVWPGAIAVLVLMRVGLRWRRRRLSAKTAYRNASLESTLASRRQEHRVSSRGVQEPGRITLAARVSETIQPEPAPWHFHGKLDTPRRICSGSPVTSGPINLRIADLPSKW